MNGYDTLKGTALAVAFCLGVPLAGLAQDAYEDGQRAIRGQDWDLAVERFEEAERRDEERVDAALYWQAYALCKSGRERQAKRRLRDLERNHQESPWLDDARVLRVECGNDTEQLATGELDPELRMFAISRLMERDPDRALPLLLEMIEQPRHKGVLEEALFVLGVSDHPEAQAAMARIARSSDRPEVQAQAIHMLGAAGNRQALELLDEVYAQTDSKPVRRAVIQAWVAADTSQPLLAALRAADDPDLQREAIHALGAMDAQEQLRGLYSEFDDPRTRRALLEALAVADDSAGLMEILRVEENPELRRAAIQGLAIADHGGETIEQLREIYDQGRSLEEQSAVLDALIILDDGSELALAIARSDTDPQLVRKAIQVLGVNEDSNALRSLYRELDSLENRRAVLQSLAIAEDAEGLSELLATETDDALRSQAIQSIAIAAEDAAGRLLLPAYEGASGSDKRAIIQALLISEDVEGLADLLERESDRELRRMILRTLAMVDSAEAEEYLFDLIEDEQ